VVCDSGLLVRVESGDEKKREKKKTALVNKKEKKKKGTTQKTDRHETKDKVIRYKVFAWL